MSIERIKEYRSKDGYLRERIEAIENYIIEQHEMCHRESQPMVYDKESMQPMEQCVPVVEVGQVRRWKDSFKTIKITKIEDNGKVLYMTEWGNEYYEEKIFLEKVTELVTMDNIREGEWVECINSDGWPFEVGIKSKVNKVYENKISCEYFGVNKKHYNDFCPCLPPTEQPKLYTQEELDKAVQEAKEYTKKMIFDEVGKLVKNYKTKD